MQPRHVRYVWHAGTRGLAPPQPVADWIERHHDADAAATVILIDGRSVDDPGIVPASVDAMAVVAERMNDGGLAIAVRTAADDMITLDVSETAWQRRLIGLADLAVLRRATAQRRHAARDFFNREPAPAGREPARPAVLFVGAPGPHKLAVVDALLGWSIAAYAETIVHARTHLETAQFAAVVLTDPLDLPKLQQGLAPLVATIGPGTPSFVVVRSSDAAFSIDDALGLGASEVIDPGLPKDLIQRRLARAIVEADLRLALREERLFAAANDPISGRVGHSACHAFLQAALKTPRMTHHGALLAVRLEGLDAINGEAGYAAGDRALAAAGAALRLSVRAEDLVGRLDGSSFAVWVCDVDDIDICVLARRLQDAVRHAWLGDGGPGLSARVGWARPTTGDDARSLSRRAKSDVQRGLLRVVS